MFGFFNLEQKGRIHDWTERVLWHTIFVYNVQRWQTKLGGQEILSYLPYSSGHIWLSSLQYCGLNNKATRSDSNVQRKKKKIKNKATNDLVKSKYKNSLGKKKHPTKYQKFIFNNEN